MAELTDDIRETVRERYANAAKAAATGAYDPQIHAAGAMPLAARSPMHIAQPTSASAQATDSESRFESGPRPLATKTTSRRVRDAETTASPGVAQAQAGLGVTPASERQQHRGPGDLGRPLTDRQAAVWGLRARCPVPMRRALRCPGRDPPAGRGVASVCSRCPARLIPVSGRDLFRGRMIVGPERQPGGYWIWPASTLATKLAVASANSAGASSCRKCAPARVTWVWLGQARQ